MKLNRLPLLAALCSGFLYASSAFAQLPQGEPRPRRSEWWTGNVTGAILALQQYNTTTGRKILELRKNEGTVVWEAQIAGHTRQSGYMKTGASATVSLPSVTSSDVGAIHYDTTVNAPKYVNNAGSWVKILGSGAEEDTLATVTARGASTSSAVLLGAVGTPTAEVSVSGKVSIAPAGTTRDETYNGSLVVTKPSASGQHINLIRRAVFGWSIGYLYNTSTFAIGPVSATDSAFTTAPFTISTAGAVSLSTPLGVASGGTGRSTLATDKLLAGAGGSTALREITLGTNLSLAGDTLNASTGGVSGSGTIGVVPKFTGASALGDSVLSETSGELNANGNVGIRIANPTLALHVMGGGGRVQALSVPSGLCNNGLGSTSAPCVTPQGTTGSTSYFYYVVAVDGAGNRTPPSVVGATTTGNATLSGTNFNRITWVAVPGAVSYEILRTSDLELRATGITTTTYDDTGGATSVYSPATRNGTGDFTVDGLTTAASAKVTGLTASLVYADADGDLVEAAIGAGLAYDTGTNTLSATGGGTAGWDDTLAVEDTADRIIYTQDIIPSMGAVYNIGSNATRFQTIYASDITSATGTFSGSVAGNNFQSTIGFFLGNTSSVSWSKGSGSPEGAISAPVGSYYSRTDGGAGTTFYVKESGAGNTGWVAK